MSYVEITSTDIDRTEDHAITLRTHTPHIDLIPLEHTFAGPLKLTWFVCVQKVLILQKEIFELIHCLVYTS